MSDVKLSEARIAALEEQKRWMSAAFLTKKQKQKAGKHRPAPKDFDCKSCGRMSFRPDRGHGGLCVGCELRGH